MNAIQQAPVLKFEYHPPILLENPHFDLTTSQKKSSEKTKWAFSTKIKEIILSVFQTLAFVTRPLHRSFKWITQQFAIIGFWIVHPKKVSFSHVKEVYHFVNPLIEKFPTVSKSVLMEKVLEHDAQFRHSAKFFLKMLQEARQDCLHSENFQTKLPTEKDLQNMFRCHLVANIICEHLLDKLRYYNRIPENSQLICQIENDPLKELIRIDELTLDLMQQMHLDPGHYIQTLRCLASADRIVETPDLHARFASIFPLMQKNLSISLLKERFSELETNHLPTSNWFSSDPHKIPLEAVIVRDRREQGHHLLESDFSFTVTELPNRYKAVRDLISHLYKQTLSLKDCVTYGIPSGIWSRTKVVWQLRIARWASDFFEVDHVQRQRHFFESHILTASLKIPELADPNWMEEACKHFETWQSLSYIIESHLKTSPSFNGEFALDHEDFLYVFITSHFCRYQYDKGLRRSYKTLKKYFSTQQIEQFWLTNSLQGQLYFCDAHTLRMLERLQKNPQAFGEILKVLANNLLPQEAEKFQKCFDIRCPLERFESIEIISMGVSREERTLRFTVNEHSPSYTAQNYSPSSVSQVDRTQAYTPTFLSNPTYYDSDNEDDGAPRGF